MTRVVTIALTSCLIGCTAAYDSGDFEVCDELPAECRDDLEPWTMGPKCQRSTYDCSVACPPTDGDCLFRCLAADGDAVACTGCAVTEIAECARSRGCRCEWETLRCCKQANGCRDGLFEMCPACGREQSDYDVCLAPLLEECIADLDQTCVL